MAHSIEALLLLHLKRQKTVKKVAVCLTYLNNNPKAVSALTILTRIDQIDAFGKEFAGLIEVCHLKPLGSTSGKRPVDPESDLVPLCPNCHRMAHYHTKNCRSLDELRRLIARSRRAIP